MAALQGKVAAALQHLGFALEARAFVPHLTLGRARPGHAITLEGVPDAAELQAVEVAAREIRVMRSDLSPSGARHSVLEHCSLYESGDLEQTTAGG
jgi:2'-5' RNA ligase